MILKETYLISYDLSDEDSYEDLYDYIKSYNSWAHISESLWAIKTNKNAKKIRDEIVDVIDDEDSTIFVIKSGVEAAWINVICKNAWLKDNL